MKILILLASTMENKKLADKLAAQIANLEIDTQILNLVDYDLPLYDMNKENNQGIPEKIHEIMDHMKNSSSYIVVSPEYNGSIPPVLSNAIAWITRTGTDFRKLFINRFILLATHSGSGGHGVLTAMRAQFVKLGALVLAREILTTYDIPLDEKSCKRKLKQLIKLSKV